MRLTRSFTMRFTRSLIFVSLSLAFFSAVVPAASVSAVISGYLFPGETFTKSLEEIRGNDYYFVSVNGSQAMIFAAMAGGDGYRLVSDAGEIRALLAARLAKQNVSYSLLPNASERDEIWAALSRFNESRTRGERACAELIGMDRFPCFDLDSCWRACYTPACQTMKIGSGAVFLGYAQEMYVNGSFIDGNLSEARERLYAVSADDQGDWADCDAATGDECSAALEENFRLLLENIQGVRFSAGENENNPLQLREAVGFCYPMAYEYNGLINATAKITMKYDLVRPLLRINETTRSIYDSSARRIELQENLSSEGACMSMRAQAEIELAKAKARVNRALYSVSSTSLANRSRALDSAFAALECGEADEDDVLAFNSTFFPTAATLGADADEALARYNSVREEYSALNATVSSLRESAPGNPEVESLYENVSLLGTSMVLPELDDLDVLQSQISAAMERAQELAASPGGSQLQSLLLPLAAAVILVAAAAGAFALLRRKKA